MTNELIMSLKCTNGILNVFENRIEISRKTAFGFASQGIKGDRTLFYRDLTSVEYKKPTFFANGYIKFILPGTSETDSALNLTGTTTKQSSQDPNTLILRALGKEMPEESKKAYDVIMQKISEAKNPTVVVSGAVSNADELGKFKKLFDDGVITQDEFNSKKKQLLGT